jgi:hypothetical protein
MFFTSRNRKLVANVKKLEELEKNVIALNEENKELLNIIESREKALQKIIAEKSNGFPWLAEAIGEFYKYQDFEIARYLEIKKHPAYKKAEAVREVALENKLLRKQIKIAQNFVTYYETLFPWINEYVGEDLDDLLEGIAQSSKEDGEEETDPVLKFIPKAEYEKLPPSERNQKALDRYISSRKKPYEIGRDYERYIGYLYEKDGYKVEYMGIEKGLEDLGRDLVCVKDNEIEIVQCKCWASHKTIHEKHINQLYGTVVKYFIDHNQIVNRKKNLTLFPELISSGQIKAAFVTSTKLSETAKKFATALGVKIIEEKPLDKYPLIKCNIGANGDRIYHLPFDQQYDKTLIKNKGEFYASTVKEAEDKGFRRAFRWRGTSN